MKIALFSALPHEYAAFKKLGGPWRLRSAKPFRIFSCSFFQNELTLLETGMGKGRLQDAFRRVVGLDRPDLVVSMGFGGSLCPDIEVGQVILGSSILCPEPVAGPVLHGELHPDIHSELSDFCRLNGIGTARLVTLDHPESKSVLRRRFGDSPSMVDMESYFLCRFSLDAGIPFMVFRAVSDGVDDEIDFDLSSISDEAGKVVVGKALAAVIKSPRLVRSFFHLWRKSRKAAQSLAHALAAFLSLPEPELRQMVLGSRVGCSGVRDLAGP